MHMVEVVDLLQEVIFQVVDLRLDLVEVMGMQIMELFLLLDLLHL